MLLFGYKIKSCIVKGAVCNSCKINICNNYEFGKDISIYLKLCVALNKNNI